jgi:hypothetical protein
MSKDKTKELHCSIFLVQPARHASKARRAGIPFSLSAERRGISDNIGSGMAN